MIVHESYAVCEGCRYRQLTEGDKYPASWPALVDENGSHHFCSRTCLTESAGGRFAVPSRIAARLGLGLKDVELLMLVAQGYTNKEIGVRMGLAERTVKNRMTAINNVLSTFDRVQAILVAHSLGLLNLNTLAEQVVERLAPEFKAA